jgi:gluconolactonase
VHRFISDTQCARLFRNAINPVCIFLLAAAALVPLAPSPALAVGDSLYVSTVFVSPGKFTTSIEGPACDAAGNLFAVNFGHSGTIGKVTPSGEASLYATLPSGSTGNGIRFDSRGIMLVADYTGHNVLAVDPLTQNVSVYAHEASMSQPNDLAIGANDIIYASDPNWDASTGRIWRIGTDGAVTLIASGLGTTNGIEVAPGDGTLYVGESNSYNVWAFDLSPDGNVSNKRLLINLPNTTLDGMRCDTAGNLYVTRMSGSGFIAVVSPAGELLREVPLIGNEPSNIEFGGPDGRTCYVTMANNGSIETFRTEFPGRSWQLWHDRVNSVAERIESPRSFTLAGAFPNPFNAATTIQYTLAADMSVQLSVYNLIGQRVAVLKEGQVKAGSHAVSWNAGGFSSGTYIVRLTAGGKAETRKVMLMK